MKPTLPTAESATEAAAQAIYAEFIRHASGTRRYVRDRDGKVIGEETPDMAVARRWAECPQATRDEFTAYALAAKPFFEVVQ